MSDSKKLPIIEIGDTVVLNPVPRYVKRIGEYEVCKLSPGAIKVVGCYQWITRDCIQEVLKPPKARVYSESAMELAFHCGRLYQGREGDTDFKTFIQTLNTEGK